MKVVHLSNEEKHNGFTHMIVITHADLTNTSVSGTPTQTLQALKLNPGDVVRHVCTKLVTPFKNSADAAQNSTSIEVGDDGDVDRFLVAQELNLNGTEVLYKAGTGTALAYTAADTLDVKVTGTLSKALSDLDAGELHLFVGIIPLPGLSDPTE